MSPVSANAETLKVETEKANAENQKRGDSKGTRVSVGQTRGKNPSVISWESFDKELPKTLPADLPEFVSMTKCTEAELLDYAIEGFNKAQYSAASDEIGEYINDAWDKDTQAQFRIVVRNLSRMPGQTLDSAVALIKPGVEAAFAAKSK